MRILVVGGGGREHALGRSLVASASVEAIVALPGNPGLAAIGTCVPGSPTDLERVVSVATGRADDAGGRFDLVVIGPEAPLAAGLADRIESVGVPVFGPRAGGARIEASKIFARELMSDADVPGTGFRVFDDPAAALAHVERARLPLVVKADGLCGGKGAIVCRRRSEALAAVHGMLVEGAFGEAGRRILVEDFLVGEEVSVLAITDGRTVLPLVPSQDHKAAFDGDVGPNTGGMGAYAPWRRATPAFTEEVVAEILVPTLRALAAHGVRYRGCLYAGLMSTPRGPRVVEFNCRFGDPETQAILPLLETDLAKLLLAAATGALGDEPLPHRPGAAVHVVLASGGYPGSYRTGVPIEGVEAAEAIEGVEVVHAGTAIEGGRLVTAGGRVLGVTALGSTLALARARAYDAVDRIRFEGKQVRRDIGARGANGEDVGLHPETHPAEDVNVPRGDA